MVDTLAIVYKCSYMMGRSGTACRSFFLFLLWLENSFSHAASATAGTIQDLHLLTLDMAAFRNFHTFAEPKVRAVRKPFAATTQMSKSCGERRKKFIFLGKGFKAVCAGTMSRQATSCMNNSQKFNDLFIFCKKMTTEVAVTNTKALHRYKGLLNMFWFEERQFYHADMSSTRRKIIERMRVPRRFKASHKML